MLGIYIHIPFCLKRCNYCDFCSSVAGESKRAEYVAALTASIRKYKGMGLGADTVYFGGGTPSLLSECEINEIMSAVRETFSVSGSAEITSEANPGTVSYEKLTAFRDAGINRISFGIQSCKDDELYALGRLHNYQQAVEAVEFALKAGVENISCDLMIGIPYQTLESLSESVNSVCNLGVKHISAYMLKIEEGTPFDCNKIRALIPDDDTVADMYLKTVQMLSERGFDQYEISNFAVPGFESCHNLKYWTGEEYLGFGPSAHSYFGGNRFYIPDDIDGFIKSSLREPETEDSSPDKLEEYIMLGLRLRKGILLSRVNELGGDPERLLKIAGQYEKAGYLTISGGRFALTPKGFLMSNGIISHFI